MDELGDDDDGDGVGQWNNLDYANSNDVWWLYILTACGIAQIDVEYVVDICSMSKPSSI